MIDYTHPDDFALLLQTIPYQVWMWLDKETNREPTYMRIEQNPMLPSPEIWDRKQIPDDVLSGTPEVRHTKTVFLGTRKSKRPKPFDQESIFSLIEVNYCFKEKEDKYPLAMYFSEDAINIHIKSDEEGLTRVIGEYDSSWPELVKYMKQIRDALVEKFPVVVRESSVTPTTKPPTQIVDTERDKLLPRTEEGRKYWKKCYTHIKKQRKIYKKDYDDGESDDPSPSFDDIRDYLINKGEKDYSERTLRNIIKAGDKGWLK